jgi:hypothetical protein
MRVAQLAWIAGNVPYSIALSCRLGAGTTSASDSRRCDGGVGVIATAFPSGVPCISGSMRTGDGQRLY